MKLIKLNLNNVLNEFERELFSKDREFEIADAMEFELFDRDKDYVYGLQFNREDKTYSIIAEVFEENGGDWSHQEYLETYNIDVYNREFLIDRIMDYYVSSRTK